MALAEVSTIYESNFRDAATTLRRIADDIDEGKHGHVGCAAIALLGNELAVFGAGPDSEGPAVHYLFCCAAAMMVSSALEHGKQQ